ncbi:MAG: class I SAM-dependent methyltransferase [Candidatus Stahlbacteria bacterium]|nr:class I SAM-dependent methyltransferase [Candidatus Stahlbacteria bacterium]
MKEEEFWNNFANSLKDISYQPGIYELNALKEIGDIRGKKILDCGIGRGISSSLLTQKGANVFGFDISLNMLKIAQSQIKEASFCKMKAEQLGFKDEQFDAVFGIHCLHHTNISESIPEIYRILKKGGRGVFVETFGFNPVIAFCRTHLAGKYGIPRYGTLDEHPLIRKDICLINSYFKTTLVVPDFLFMKLFARSVFRFRYKIINSFCSLFDRWILKAASPLSHYSYTQLILIEKRI